MLSLLAKSKIVCYNVHCKHCVGCSDGHDIKLKCFCHNEMYNLFRDGSFSNGIEK